MIMHCLFGGSGAADQGQRNVCPEETAELYYILAIYLAVLICVPGCRAAVPFFMLRGHSACVGPSEQESSSPDPLPRV